MVSSCDSMMGSDIQRRSAWPKIWAVGLIVLSPCLLVPACECCISSCTRFEDRSLRTVSGFHCQPRYGCSESLKEGA